MTDKPEPDAPTAARADSIAGRVVDGVRVGVGAIVLVPNLTRQRHRDTNRRHNEAKDGGTPAAPKAVHSLADRLGEAVGLAEAIDLSVGTRAIVPVPTPRPATLFGTGKVAEIKLLVEAEATALVVIDHAVTPIQQRNLENAWQTKVLDRTGLILEIFGRRAQTREGRLQVELAHLSYQKSRLVRSWTHLERQRGGAGFLGGPGESQLELDRRLIQDRIDGLKRELADVVKTRALHRAGRRKVPYPVVAIVGYTNAGKSTLFNRLTGAAVMAKDQVFATLDPTMRELRVGAGRRVMLSDTVGFISDLPTTLVAAFRATLEEVIEADLILHVRDISHAESDAQRQDVEAVLVDLGIEAGAAEAPILEVWNKIDRLDADARGQLDHDARRAGRPPVLLSAVTGEGCDALLAAIDARLGRRDLILALDVPAHAGRLMGWLHDNTAVLATETGDDGTMHVRVRIDPDLRGKLDAQLKRAGIPSRAG